MTSLISPEDADAATCLFSQVMVRIRWGFWESFLFLIKGAGEAGAISLVLPVLVEISGHPK